MALEFGSCALLKIHNKFVGLDQNVWDIPIRLKDQEPTADEVFIIEPAQGGAQDGQPMSWKQPFVLRASNGRYVVVDTASRQELHAWEPYPESATYFFLTATGAERAPDYDKPLILSVQEGGCLYCEPNTGSRVVRHEQAGTAHKDTIFQWVNAKNLPLGPPLASTSFPQATVSKAASGETEEDDWTWEDDPDAFLTEEAITSTEVPRGAGESHDPEIALLPSPSVISGESGVADGPAPLDNLSRLETHRGSLIDLEGSLQTEKDQEQALIAECENLAERCAYLTLNANRLKALAAGLPTLQQRLAELEASVSPDGLLAEGLEGQIALLISTWMQKCNSIKEHFSLELQTKIDETVKLEHETALMQEEIIERTKILLSAQEKYGTVKEVLEAHLQANKQVQAILPSADHVQDLLNEAERLLRESDKALQQALLTIQKTSAAKIITFREDSKVTT